MALPMLNTLALDRDSILVVYIESDTANWNGISRINDTEVKLLEEFA